MILQILVKCRKCGEKIEDAGNRSRKYCGPCLRVRRKEHDNRHNRARASVREFKRIQVNLFKNFVMWGEMHK